MSTNVVQVSTLNDCNIISEDLPPGWEAKTIDELSIRVGSGITPTGGSEAYTEDGILFIRSQNVRNEGLDLSDVVYIDKKTHQSMARSEVLPFDVLLNITGASIGRCCFMPDSLGKANQNQHVCTIRLADAEIDNANLLSAILRSPIGQQQISRLNAGGNREGLNYQQIRTFCIPWPPAKERRNISQVLSSLDTVISKTEAVIAKLRKVKAGMLHDLLTRGLDENGKLRDPIRHPEQFKDSPLGRIPKDLDLQQLGAVCEKIGDGVHTSVSVVSHGYPFLYVSCVRDGQILWEKCSFISEETYQTVNRGKKIGASTVLYTVVGSYGHAAVVHSEIKFSFQRHIAYLVPSEKVSPEFLALWLNSSFGRMLSDQLALGNAQKTITLALLSSMAILLPCYNDQQIIVDRVASIDKEIKKTAVELAKLQTIKAGLMHDLLTGLVRIPPQLLEAMP